MNMTETGAHVALHTIEVIDATKSAKAVPDRERFAVDVLMGLSATRKSLPSKYMYDDEGSRLFDLITTLPEYYPTQCEISVLETHRERIAQYAPKVPFNLIEFGAGSLRKPGILIERFLELNLDFTYVPLDISPDAMGILAESMAQRFPQVKMHALISDYFTGIQWLNRGDVRHNIVLFLGSNIGNFTRPQTEVFLRNLWNGLNHGDHVIIGFDLRKDIELLLAAYNDTRGVTAEFNLNLLRRINRELGGQFNLARFRHFGTYNVFNGAMESYLVSQDEQEVFIEAIGRTFPFHAWEPINTEYSYKYLETDIDLLARNTGFRVCEHLYDNNRYFIDSVWEVQKEDG
jgi:L-histidine N-alpha-methyltransferase